MAKNIHVMKAIKSGLGKPKTPGIVKAGLKPMKGPKVTSSGIGGLGQAQAGAGPATPSPPTTTPLPWDAQYEGANANANLNYNNAMLGYNQKEEATKAQYGFDSQYASDPYTRANMLQRSWDQNNLSSVNSMAARGQGYSGATTNALDTNRFGYLQGYDTAQKEYTSSLADIQQGRLSADASKRDAIAQAEAERLSQALQSAQNDASYEAPSGLGGAPVGGGGQSKKKKKGKK